MSLDSTSGSDEEVGATPEFDADGCIVSWIVHMRAGGVTRRGRYANDDGRPGRLLEDLGP